MSAKGITAMRVYRKSNYFKACLMISTALTAAVSAPASPARAADLVVDSRVEKSRIDDGTKYILNGGTWNGSTSWDIGGAGWADNESAYPDENNSAYPNSTFPNGIYQAGNTGMVISNATGKPEFEFNGGVIWEDSAYGNFQGNMLLNNGNIVGGTATGGDFDINAGVFRGAIDIRKGNLVDAVWTGIKEGTKLSPKEYAIMSKGNLNIYGGEFYATKDSQILMYKGNTGTINVGGSTQWWVSANKKMTVNANGHEINITGGQFDLAAGGTLAFSGGTGSLTKSNSMQSFTGEGTLQLDFSDFSINSALNFENGGIKFTGGMLSLTNGDVVVSRFEIAGSALLEISEKARLSIKSDLVINGNLSGGGELILSDKANAKFGKLDSFGTVTLGSGTLTFTDATSNDVPVSLKVLNGTQKQDSAAGIINVNASMRFGTVNLGYSTLYLNEGMEIVDALNFDHGTIVFKQNDKSLTLQSSATLWNTSTIVTDSSVVADATEGKVTIKDGKTLTFADETDENGNKTAPDKHFESKGLTVFIEDGANAVFTADKTTFKTLTAENGKASVDSGELNVETVRVGDKNLNGDFIVASGATANVSDTFDAMVGATVQIDGTLNVANLNTEGQTDGKAATLTGGGTINVTKTALLKGGISGLGLLQVTGTNADKAEVVINSTKSNTLDKMRVTYGTVSISNGELTIDSLAMDNGAIELAHENAILALRQSPSSDGSIVGKNNSISGKGTLKLLNDTSISFGGGTDGTIKYLGGLNIGTGTASITSGTTLGSVKFSSAGGTLNIADGATLTLSDADGVSCTRSDKCRIQTGANKLVGKGTLNLVNGDGSSFGGETNIAAINFGAANGTMTFDYSGTSEVKTLTVNAAGANIVVNGGKLGLTNGFGNANTTVGGSGTLALAGDGTFSTGTGRLSNLEIGAGTVSVGGDSKFINIVYAGDGGVLDIGKTASVSGNITVGEKNTVSGDELIVSGTSASGKFKSGLENLKKLTAENGAVLNFETSTQVGASGGGLNLKNNAAAIIAADAVLSVGGDLGDSASDSFVRGDGTLSLSDTVQVYSFLDGLKNLTVAGGNATLHKTSNVAGKVSVASGAVLNFAGGAIQNGATIGGTLQINADTTLPTVSFESGKGELAISKNTTVFVTEDITVGSGSRLTALNGTGDTAGTLRLVGNANATFAMNDSDNFAGRVIIGAGTATVNTNAAFGLIAFNDDQGGTLNIADGKILTVGTITTDGANAVTGAGTLNLTGAGSAFKAPLSGLGTLQISGGSAEFYNDIHIKKLAFNNGGEVKLGKGMTMTVTDMTQSNTTNAGGVYGDGAFTAGTGNIQFSTGGKYLAKATIGSGTLNFIGNSNIGSLNYSAVTGTINIADNITVSVGSDFSGIGILTGGESAQLHLSGNANAVFNKAIDYKGKISADSGDLSFMSTTGFSELTLDGASATFYDKADIGLVSVKDGSSLFKLDAGIDTLNITGSGSVKFNSTAALNKMDVGAGTVVFAKDASLKTGGSVGGVLDLGVNTLTVGSGNLVLNDNSRLKLTISRDATDVDGNVQSTGYGKIVMSSGSKLDIRSNVLMDLNVDYGLHTAKDGSVFRLVSGDRTGEFVFENNRYSLVKADCDAGTGMCYRLTQTSTGGEVAEKESANENQITTAKAFLDGDLFSAGTKIYSVAEHLDSLSQSTSKRHAYLGALTAVAPDVSGAMTNQPMALHSKISGTLAGRLNGLMSNMGDASPMYRDIQKMYGYGRSGGSPYRSRFMRAEDYYRRAGYYDLEDKPVTRQRPAYRRSAVPNSVEEVEARAERKRWAQRRPSYSTPKEFGAWAQMYYNTAEYLSTGKPDGFSNDTNGVAFGADAQLFNVFALGVGYAQTTTTVDTMQRSTDIDGSSYFVYGMYKPSDWFVSGILNMTSMTYEETKNLSGMTLKDSYDGSSIGATLMFGKDLKTWTPSVGVRYVSADRDAHTDEIGQEIGSVSAKSTTFVFEARSEADFAKGVNSQWHRELSAALTYDLSSSSESATVRLPNGSGYTVKGESMDPVGVELGASLAFVYGEHVDVSAGYNLEWRPDYLSHTVMATFRYSF